MMIDLPWVYLVAWVVSVAIIIWRYEHRLSSWRRQLTDLKHRADFLEEELLACRNKVKGNCTDSDSTEEPSNIQQQDNLPFLQITSVDNTEKDDLKIVEGIGPKIEKLLHGASIFTFAELAATPTQKIRHILENAGSRYLMHDPTTWSKQARLAHEGQWDELKKWQSELDKGRIV